MARLPEAQPDQPGWADRDRFILSNGHGSMLLYSLLHLTGYDLPLEELKNFRQLHSKTPGHPEIGYTPGVETTTGPLGGGWPTLSVWRLPSARWRPSSTSRATISSITLPMYLWVTAV